MGSKAQLKGQDLADAKEEIIEGLWRGKSLLKILEDNDDLPKRNTVFKWCNPESQGYDKEFANNYAHAREESAHIDADKVEQLQQDVRDGILDAQQARVIMDGLKWTAAVKLPKKYGKKVELGASPEIVDAVRIFIPDNGRNPDNQETE